MSTYRFLDYELSEGDFCLSRGGQRLAIEPKALRVLTLLVSRAGRLVNKQDLLDSVWPDTFVEENTLTRTIAVLRRTLGDSSRDSKLIETVPTRGYRFIAAVEIVAATTARLSAASPGSIDFPVAVSVSAEGAASGIDSLDCINPIASKNPTISYSLPARQAGTANIGTWKLKWLLPLCLGLAVILALTVRHRPVHGEQPIRSLAVLPLDDLSPGTSEDYFVDGMTDDLITELARIPGLRVVSRTSVLQEKGVRKPLAQIARELDVDAIVEGSVVRSGGRVRISAQLIDARSDKHLWAQTFERPLGDVLSLQDSVARDIALQTSAVLTPAARAELTSGRHVDPAAYDSYLRGRYFIQRRDGSRAASYFRKTIDLAPNYAAAHAGLAEALLTQVVTGEHHFEVMPPAVAAARRAIELDPYSGEAYTALGALDSTYFFDWNSAEKNLRRGIELSPSSADAETYFAFYLLTVGRPTEAVNAMQRAVALDPLSFWANRALGTILYYSRRYDDSLVALQRASEIAPDKTFDLVEGWNSNNFEMQGRYSDAFAADLKDLASELSPQDIEAFRSAFQTGGWKGYQEARIHFLLPRSLADCYMNPLAMSYARLGDRTEAFRWFNRDLDKHCGRTILDLEADPRLDKIRDDERFRALLHRVNLPPER